MFSISVAPLHESASYTISKRRQESRPSTVLTKARTSSRLLPSMVLGGVQEDTIPLTIEPQASGRSQARAAWMTSGRAGPVCVFSCAPRSVSLPSGLSGRPSASIWVVGGYVGIVFRDMGGHMQARGLLHVWTKLVDIIHRFWPSPQDCPNGMEPGRSAAC